MSSGAHWPETVRKLVDTVSKEDCQRVKAQCEYLRLGKAFDHLFDVHLHVAAWVAHSLVSTVVSPITIGINGAQGSGKSTAATLLQVILDDVFGRRVCAFSLDDFYLDRDRRRQMARDIHPLLQTRGVPGTHDVELCLETMERLVQANADSITPIPRFDKAKDDPYPEKQWTAFVGRPDCVIFEGWCVGTVPEPDDRLQQPVNALERDEDPDGAWRRFVNKCLYDYQALFARIDRLIMLQVPSFRQVREWRLLQERKLAEADRRRQQSAHGDSGATAIMNATQLERFTSYFERLTRWTLEEMPSRADLVLRLDEAHRIADVRFAADLK